MTGVQTCALPICIACGLSGLIWVQNSPLFQDQDDGHDHGQRFREAIEQPHYESDEEVFVLPQSDDIEEDKYESNDNQQHPYRSSRRIVVAYVIDTQPMVRIFCNSYSSQHRPTAEIPPSLILQPTSAGGGDAVLHIEHEIRW